MDKHQAQQTTFMKLLLYSTCRVDITLFDFHRMTMGIMLNVT